MDSLFCQPPVDAARVECYRSRADLHLDWPIGQWLLDHCHHDQWKPCGTATKTIETQTSSGEFRVSWSM